MDDDATHFDDNAHLQERVKLLETANDLLEQGISTLSAAVLTQHMRQLSKRLAEAEQRIALLESDRDGLRRDLDVLDSKTKQGFQAVRKRLPEAGPEPA